mmetsp:Transcript_77300/g.127658  ORF Transcript_77300/g.127658 Transcript_77300/m.127658 type:complete len:560 (+) Transcript_77300:53-1732(+)|eukprot:s805_g27.t1
MVYAREDVENVLAARGWREVKQIGEGSFAKALLVEASDGTQAVCKVMDISEASKKEAEDAAKEGRLLASLQHPFVVRYRDSFCEAGVLCLIMDFCEGGELAKQIRRARRNHQRIPEEQILRWFTQAMLSLKYIHDKHILHRDLKPANFFLTKTGSLKMGDFGIAKSMACTIAFAKTRIGTPYYLSPEVCQEKPYAWPSDMWSMGCILYEMCALQVPFDAHSISGLVQKICYGPLPIVPDSYSDFLRRLCRQLLDRDPKKRPSADEVLQLPEIQKVVRQMLEEVRSLQQQERKAKAVTATAPTGSYRKDDVVEYYSVTHGEWLPATIIDTDTFGRVMIDLRPGVWLSSEVQASKIRPRESGSSDESSGSQEGWRQKVSDEDASKVAPGDQQLSADVPQPPPKAERRRAPISVRRESPRPQPPAPAPPEEPRFPRPEGGYDQLDRLLGEKAKPTRSPSAGAIERGGIPGPIRRAPSVGGLNHGRRPPALVPLENPPGSSRAPSSDSCRAGTPPTRPGSGELEKESLSTPNAPGSRRTPLGSKPRHCLAAAALAAGRVIAGA